MSAEFKVSCAFKYINNNKANGSPFLPQEVWYVVGGRAGGRLEPLLSVLILINGFRVLREFTPLIQSLNSPTSFTN